MLFPPGAAPRRPQVVGGFDRVYELLFKALQLVVLSAANHVTDLIKLYGITQWAPRMAPDTCGVSFDERGTPSYDDTLIAANQVLPTSYILHLTPYVLNVFPPRRR